MSQYLNQYPQSRPNDNIQHYRIQIRKLKQKLIEKSKEYERRIGQLQGQLKNHRKPIFQNSTANGIKNNNDLNYQIYQKDNQIKELKAQNSKLRQVINNPDQILIKKNNNFEMYTEKDNEINRLKKALIQIQRKYDGQFFSQSKMKKQFEMLKRQNEELKLRLIKLEKNKDVFNKVAEKDQLLDNIRLKKQLQASRKDIQELNKIIQYQQGKNDQLSRVSIIQNQQKRQSKRVVADLGVKTQLDEIKLELEQFKAKNRDLKNKVVQLTQVNQRLQAEKKQKKSFQYKNVRESVNPKKNMNQLQKQQAVIQYIKNRQTISKQLIAQPVNEQPTLKKSSKYEELGLDDDFFNRVVLKQ